MDHLQDTGNNPLMVDKKWEKGCLVIFRVRIIYRRIDRPTYRLKTAEQFGAISTKGGHRNQQ